jgi:endonuclease/exonuclease/phosphatase family metal-dependent hydrolase
MHRILALALLLVALPAAAQELKLATWNIAWLTAKPAGHPDIPRNVPRRTEADFARLQRYAAALDADVVAIQEVDGRLAAARVFDATRYDFHFTNEPDVQGVGFAIRKTLRWRPNPDLAALGLRDRLRRGADITVETPSGPLRLLSVHLKGGCLRDRLDGPRPDCVDLERQADILAGWVRERGREGVGFAVLGDFNRQFPANDDFLARLTAAAPLAHTTQGRTNPCWGRDWSFIDHILLGGAAREKLLDGSLRVLVYRENDRRLTEMLSDHCPVSVRLGAVSANNPGRTPTR